MIGYERTAMNGYERPWTAMNGYERLWTSKPYWKLLSEAFSEWNSAPKVLSWTPIGTRDVVWMFIRLSAGVALSFLALIWVGVGILILPETAPATSLVALFCGCKRIWSRILLASLLRAVITNRRMGGNGFPHTCAVDRSPLGGGFQLVHPPENFCSKTAQSVKETRTI